MFCFSHLSNYFPVSPFYNLFCWKSVLGSFYNTKTRQGWGILSNYLLTEGGWKDIPSATVLIFTD